MKKAIPALVPFVVVTLLTELLVRQGLVKAYLVPPPSSIFRLGTLTRWAASMSG